MRYAKVHLGLLAVLWGTACGRSTSNSIVVVTVAPSPAKPAVTQLRVALKNAGTSDILLFPPSNSSAPIKFNAVLAVTFAKSRIGELEIDIEALDALSSVVASGTGKVDIVVGGRADTSIPLADKGSPDGGILDSGLSEVGANASETGTADTRTVSDGTVLDVLVGHDSADLGGNGGAGGATSVDPHGGGGGTTTGTGGTAFGTGGTGSGGTPTTGGGSGGAGTGGAGSGGTPKTGTGGGGSATGGTTGARDASVSPPDSAGNCVSQVVSNGYACGSAPACSACKDQNLNSRESGCEKGIDCLAAGGASCDANCKLNCLNQAGDTAAIACITALQTAACGATGCGSTPPPPNSGG